MKKSEKDALKQKIQSENILVRRLGSWVKVGGIIFLVTAGLCVWGFTGMKDPILPTLRVGFRHFLFLKIYALLKLPMI